MADESKEVGSEAPVKKKKNIFAGLKKVASNLKEKNKKRKSTKKEKRDFKKFHDKEGRPLATINEADKTPKGMDLLEKLEKGAFTDEELGIKKNEASVMQKPVTLPSGGKLPMGLLIIIVVIVVIIFLVILRAGRK